MKCVVCNKELNEKQKKYCSVNCKRKSANNKYQDYKRQQERGRERRQKLINLKGGCCEKCGYKRNWAGLSFHHLEPSKKSFKIDLRNCSNRSWDSLLKEAEKCQLLCLICHVEVHNPDLFIT